MRDPNPTRIFRVTTAGNFVTVWRGGRGPRTSLICWALGRRRGMVMSRFPMTLLSVILGLSTQPCSSAEIPVGQVDAIVQGALKAWQVPGGPPPGARAATRPGNGLLHAAWP